MSRRKVGEGEGEGTEQCVKAAHSDSTQTTHTAVVSPPALFRQSPAALQLGPPSSPPAPTCDDALRVAAAVGVDVLDGLLQAADQLQRHVQAAVLVVQRGGGGQAQRRRGALAAVYRHACRGEG